MSGCKTNYPVIITRVNNPTVMYRCQDNKTRTIFVPVEDNSCFATDRDVQDVKADKAAHPNQYTNCNDDDYNTISELADAAGKAVSIVRDGLQNGLKDWRLVGKYIAKGAKSEFYYDPDEKAYISFKIECAGAAACLKTTEVYFGSQFTGNDVKDGLFDKIFGLATLTQRTNRIEYKVQMEESVVKSKP